MTAMHRLCLAGSLVLGLGLSGVAAAQTTDGYHSIQIFPVVVDTASFTQRFNFRNPNDAAVTVTPKYYPADATSQKAIGVLTCPDFTMQPGKTATFLTLRALCPALAAGSQFGFLYTSETSTASLPYAGFSRVANPQGNGFSVEAFPAHTFTSADSVINGLRRKAAGVSNPAFQTNCFIGNLNEVNPTGGPSSTPVEYTLYNNLSNVIGTTHVVNLQPGQIERLSDIFAVAGAPAGDYDDAQMQVVEANADVNRGEPGIISFCTVQDNTSFGADFRIAKQEVGNGGLAVPFDSLGAQDNHVSREIRTSADGVGRNFEIGTGASANTHVIYFRHPDYVQCEITDVGGTRLLPAAGLEMRMLDQDGVALVGGNDVTGWSDFFLGNKTERNNGANTRYTIEVESNQTNTGAVRSYQLHCRSGSGHTLGDLIRYKDAVDRF